MARATWLVTILLGASLALAAVARAADVPIEPSGRQFFALSVPDARSSADWYERAFGVKLLHEIETPDGAAHILILGTDALLIEIMQLRNARSPGPKVIGERHLTHGIVKIGLYVGDLDAAVAHLRGMNAKFDTQIVEDRKLDMRFVLVRDPDGNLVQLFSRLGA
jgi:catechol 2,3-dioxygenase-like lactoylglutathione lyase family enzyme